MKFSILKHPAVTEDERKFVEEQCQSGNHVHQQNMASEIYSAAMTRKAAQDMIQAAQNISESNKKHSLGMLIMTGALVVTAMIQSCTAVKSVGLDGYANKLNEVLIENSKRELETARKKLSFDIVNTLYTDFYRFGDYNSLVIRKLKANQRIEDEFNLGLYLNGFEDLYEQCKRGLITREDIRMNFLHLIGTTCNNGQAEQLIGNHGNGLKLLCNSFYPQSRLAKKAVIEKDGCD